jgi:hypothetical protein
VEIKTPSISIIHIPYPIGLLLFPETLQKRFRKSILARLGVEY